jgi:protocatechuate 3,4-dioxygenase beta subunit
MHRRNLLKIGAGTAATLVGFQALANGTTAAAAQCKKLMTPWQPEGPFYPVTDQVDTDADLIVVDGANQSARGQIIIVEGQVKDQKCNPVAGALVEIWQACHTGRYNHPSDPNTAELDPNFQYWGKAVTDKDGNYRFRTIVPGAYPADDTWMRPPHIHFKISKLGYMELITQMYFNGNDLLNSRDLILSRLSQEQQKEVVVEFKNRADAPHPIGTFNIKIEKL